MYYPPNQISPNLNDQILIIISDGFYACQVPIQTLLNTHDTKLESIIN